MSMLLMVNAMRTKVGNPLRKLVLIKLADNANDDGECWPSYQHIADQCEISKRSVINHITALCEAGLLRKELREGPKGNSSNLFHLTLCGAGAALGGAGAALGGGAGAAPRISNSFESVNEPYSGKPEIVKPTRGSRLSSEWQIPDDWIAWAAQQGIASQAARFEADKFRDFWISKPGQGGVKSDWQATWRNWIRNVITRDPKMAQQQQQSKRPRAFGE